MCRILRLVGRNAKDPVRRWGCCPDQRGDLLGLFSWAYSCCPPKLCVSLRGTVRRIMTITLTDWCRRVRVAAVVAVCTALSLGRGSSLEPVKAAASQAAAAAPSNSLEILEVRPSFFVITGAGANIGVQIGEDGVVVVDAGSAADAPAVLAAIKRISPKPIRYVIDTGPDTDHVGGNEALSKAGEKLFSGSTLGGARNAAELVAPIISAEGVLRHMATSPAGGWPTEVFHYSRKYMHLNGEAIEVLRQAAAHTDSDVFAFFRRSDVVFAGDVLDTRQFPVIDVERGGSIQGEIAALNRLVELAVPSVPVVTRE